MMESCFFIKAYQHLIIFFLFKMNRSPKIIHNYGNSIFACMDKNYVFVSVYGTCIYSKLYSVQLGKI